RLFTLPLTNAALAGWPMLYGCAAMSSLWFVGAAVARIVGADVAVPWIWPMLFCAATIAWMQALTWMPYGVRGLRVVLAVIALAAIDMGVFAGVNLHVAKAPIGMVVVAAVNLHVATATFVALLAPQLPIAYLVARYGVARARRGEVPDWSWLFRQGREPSGDRTRSADVSRTFTSAFQAQCWFEWQSHGRTLPALVALVV